MSKNITSSHIQALAFISTKLAEYTSKHFPEYTVHSFYFDYFYEKIELYLSKETSIIMEIVDVKKL